MARMGTLLTGLLDFPDISQPLTKDERKKVYSKVREQEQLARDREIQAYYNRPQASGQSSQWWMDSEDLTTPSWMDGWRTELPGSVPELPQPKWEYDTVIPGQTGGGAYRPPQFDTSLPGETGAAKSKSMLYTHSWDEVISGYSKMSPEAQARAREEWDVTMWSPYIKGYQTLSQSERQQARQTWAQGEETRIQTEKQNKEIADLEAAQAAELEKRRKQMEEIRARYESRAESLAAEMEAQRLRGNNLQAMYKSRANALANPQKSAYEGDRAQGYGGGEEGGVGATLLTHRGITGGQKLGGKSKFGGKTLLGV